jgi:hypothetical protein
MRVGLTFADDGRVMGREFGKTFSGKLRFPAEAFFRQAVNPPAEQLVRPSSAPQRAAWPVCATILSGVRKVRAR